MAELPADTTAYVFLSYASGDRPRALELANRLEARGVRVWIDRTSIAGGSSWTAEIVRGVRGCAALLVLCSPAAVTSRNVQRELNLGVEHDRPLIPLLLEPTEFPDEVQYALAGRQRIDLSNQPEAAWLPQLVLALERVDIVATPVAPVAVAAERTEAAVESRLTNFPAALTSFLGREQELADLARLLADNRLVTLTGPGGTGKTRLALAAAGAQAAAFPDGSYFVDLAPLADPTLVPAAVARALDVQERPDLPVRDSVVRFLREKRLLLVLDNYEHLLAAAEFAGALLQAGPTVTLLVTSRAPLRVPGEREYPVAPLPLPEAAQLSATVLAQNPAVALFVTRAQGVRPDFTLSDANAATVAAICARLDGLPLAIELAAARVRALPPAALLARLQRRLPVLTGGARTVPARQQTLRDTIAWSFDLLEPAEQRLFRRLGVFAGGCTLELAGAVCDADGDLGLDVLDGVSSLLEKSLLREAGGLADEPRYRMLETIREFAIGELEASGEAETVRRQFAVAVLRFARQSATPGGWARLNAELDNVRAVLGWCAERAELGVGVRLWRAVRGLLLQRGSGKEEEQWRQRLLALPEAQQPNLSRALLLQIFPHSSYLSIEDQERAIAGLEESIALLRALGDRGFLAAALELLSLLRLMQGRYGAVPGIAEESVALHLESGQTMRALISRTGLIDAALARGDLAAAATLVAANRAVALDLGEGWRSANGEALLAEARGDDAQARVLWESFVQAVGGESGDTSPMAMDGRAHLAWVALRQGDMDVAVATCAKLIAVHEAIGPIRALPATLNALAQVAERDGRLTDSARLLAAVDAQRRAFAAEVLGLSEQQEAAVERVRAALDEAAFAEAWAAGAALSPDAAIEYGLAVVAELQLLAVDTVAHQGGSQP